MRTSTPEQIVIQTKWVRRAVKGFIFLAFYVTYINPTFLVETIDTVHAAGVSAQTTMLRNAPAPAKMELRPVERVGSQEVTPEHATWLARVATSETSDIRQAEYVMNVVLNRWRTEYRGAKTLYEVIHDPAQFSAFLSPKLRKRYGGLDEDTDPVANPLWYAYHALAEDMLTGKRELKLPLSTRHFYHNSIDPPRWTEDTVPSKIVPGPSPSYPSLMIYDGVL